MWLTAALAIAGAIAGGVSYYMNTKKQNDQIDTQEELLELKYNQAKEEALKNADSEDAATTLEEAVLGSNTNNSINQIAATQEANALNYNEAEMTKGQNQGAVDATLAASGTRNSSAIQAGQMAADVSEKEIQQQEDYDRNTAAIDLANVMNNVATGAADLQNQRDDAADLRASYADGGYNSLIYEAQMDQLEDQKLDYTDGEWWAGMASSLFGGASSGLSLGDSISTTYNTWTNKTKTTAASNQTTINSTSSNNLAGSINSNFRNFKTRNSGGGRLNVRWE